MTRTAAEIVAAIVEIGQADPDDLAAAFAQLDDDEQTRLHAVVGALAERAVTDPFWQTVLAGYEREEQQ